MGFLLLLPFFLLRFGLLARLDPEALPRAAGFAPMAGRERAAYWIYQLSTGALFFTLLFLPVRWQPLGLFVPGCLLYGGGLLFLAASLRGFARPDAQGFCRQGVYRRCRHPMYVAYFLVFLGCVFLTQSWLLAGLLALFQGSAHFIILAEERACLAAFGPAYRRYMEQVRRYL